MKPFTLIKEQTIKDSKFSCYIENGDTKLTYLINLLEKTENEETFDISVIINDKKDIETSELLNKTYKNIQATKNEKLKLQIIAYVIVEGTNLISTICNITTIGLIKTGIPVKDMVAAYSSDKGILVYSVNSNQICYLKVLSDDVLEFTYEGINECNAVCEEIKGYIKNN